LSFLPFFLSIIAAIIFFFDIFLLWPAPISPSLSVLALLHQNLLEWPMEAKLPLASKEMK
jgi:hypothetical protein